MPRWILVDHESGDIHGDTAVFAPDEDLTPLEAAKRLDATLDRLGRTYEQVPRRQVGPYAYLVFTADLEGPERVPAMVDGHDFDAMNLLTRYGMLVTCVNYHEAVTPEGIASDLRGWRCGLQLTQAEAAERLGVSLRAYAHWEAGTRTPPEKMLRLAMWAISTRKNMR